ncbi:MAG: ankyrin repeat domain-containing protein [Alphaproteobacteria bacterium]
MFSARIKEKWARAKRILSAMAKPDHIALVESAHGGDKDVVQALLTMGIDINIVNGNRGDTALTAASSEGHTDVVRLLLGKGANIHATNSFGMSAATLARRQDRNGSHSEIVKMLEAAEQQTRIIREAAFLRFTPL